MSKYGLFILLYLFFSSCIDYGNFNSSHEIALNDLNYLTCDQDEIFSSEYPCDNYPIKVYDADGGNGRYICYPNNLDGLRPPKKQTHSVTGGIGYGDEGEGITFTEGKDSLQDGSNFLYRCIPKSGESITVKGDYFVTVPCDRLKYVSTSTNANYNGPAVDPVNLRLLVFSNESLIESSNNIRVMRNDHLINSTSIEDSDYYGRCVSGTLKCMALVRLDLSFSLHEKTKGLSSPYLPQLFSIVFIADDPTNSIPHGGNSKYHSHSVKDALRLDETHLKYYEAIDVSETHDAEHLSIVDFRVCNPDYKPI